MGFSINPKKIFKYMCGDISMMGMSCNAHLGFLHFSGLRYSPGVDYLTRFVKGLLHIR